MSACCRRSVSCGVCRTPSTSAAPTDGSCFSKRPHASAVRTSRSSSKRRRGSTSGPSGPRSRLRAAKSTYVPPTPRGDYAGLIVSLARQASPDMSAYADPEIVWRLAKPHHAGLIVRAATAERVDQLLAQYTTRFRRRLCGVPSRRVVSVRLGPRYHNAQLERLIRSCASRSPSQLSSLRSSSSQISKSQISSSPISPALQIHAQTPDWFQWRGPNRDGQSAETGLLKEWPAGGPKLLWRATGAGTGYSSFSSSNGASLHAGRAGRHGVRHGVRRGEWPETLGGAERSPFSQRPGRRPAQYADRGR